jgi:hypothetical protein
MVDKDIPLETKWKGNMLTHNIHSARSLEDDAQQGA